MNFQPCYKFEELNEGFSLAHKKVSITANTGAIYECDATVWLQLQPIAQIQFYISWPKSLDIANFAKVSIAGKEILGFLLRYEGSSYTIFGDNFIWCPLNVPIVGLGNLNTKIAYVIFHLFNYKRFYGARDNFERNDKIYQVELKADGWNVKIKSLPNTYKTIETLNKIGGYGLTHIGCLKKEDDSYFNGKTAIDMLKALRLFLSFSKGTWCTPHLAAGFDNKGNKVWESWSNPEESWKDPISWFAPRHCEQLANLFPGFMAKWKSERWRDTLEEVIYWYLISNCSNSDAGLILTQAAFERLSFEYAAVNKKLISEDGFKNKSFRASDRLRLLFSSLDIPIDIPASLPELKKFAKINQFKWIDAPHAFTDLRNSLVHPYHKPRGNIGKVIVDAWDLGLWYLELALLRICNYSGTYFNRIASGWVSGVESVPWDNIKVK